MHDNRSHPLLQQVPLTVSPFVNLPTATTLPYTYKNMPNTLPPSASGIVAAADIGGPSSSGGPGADGSARPKYVVSSSGHAAHPDDIIASCRALAAHVAKLQAEAEAELRALDERIRARELAEKRRLAPGWLDSDARLLEPERAANNATPVPAPAPGLPSSSSLWDRELAAGEDTAMAGVSQQQQHHYHTQGQFAPMPGFGQEGHGPGGASEMAVPDEGEELDRAFGVLALGQR
ncbi:hypothetical protein B0T24DRAFT_625680 [Lasiosphaeria ovina]|uniref:Uncharacterized protein n=1 Tax=Lasiosphaeria ovina TaxID=92902 RepID=A0AAE0N8H1_9PEZI|nr:hypothetical protein B0T24DRAFT_625680 [Lasiosphaeria ovina]